MYLCTRLGFSKTDNFLELNFKKVFQNGQLAETKAHTNSHPKKAKKQKKIT